MAATAWFLPLWKFNQIIIQTLETLVEVRLSRKWGGQ